MKKKKVIKLMSEDIKESKYYYMDLFDDKKFEKGWLAATKYWKKMLKENK